MNLGKKKQHSILSKSILSILMIFFITGCPGLDYLILDGPRDLKIDVDNQIFASREAENDYDKGLGVETITFTVTLEGSSGKEFTTEAVMGKTDIVTDYDFTQFPVPVEGVLIKIDAAATASNGTVFTATINDKSEYDNYSGWTEFANAVKFKLGYQLNSADIDLSFIELDIAPRGGNSVILKIDSGVQETGMEETDRGSTLTSMQIAIEPVLNENPTDMTFDVYTLIVTEDISFLYDPALNPDAGYEHYPWTDIWTYEEITETGKLIGSKTYTLSKYNTADPLDILDPMGDALKSYLINLTSEDSPVGKYLLIAVVLQYGLINAPVALECVEIK